jgi:quinoprotein dehydrogenase-associated probable ABC transporter substrate-binding protein
VRRVSIVAALLAFAAAAPAQQAAAPKREALRVCQDPNNLPFSNTKGEGIENKLAELFAKDLGLPVTYYSFPQRMAFIRNTLRYKLPGEDFRCDIVMGVPEGFDQVSVTKPYYRSTYALVFARGKGLDTVKSAEDFLALPKDRLSKLRIGVFNHSAGSSWLVKHGLEAQGVPYLALNADPDYYPGQIVERDLAQGKIDVAIAWGPIAGYYAQRAPAPGMTVVPLRSEPGVPMEVQMAMGVRYGEPEWKKEVESFLERRRDAITAVLRDFGVPLLELQAAPAAPR